MKHSKRVDAAQSAAAAVQTTAEKIVPLAQNAAERVLPLAQQAYGKAAPVAAGAAAAAAPLAQQVYEKAAPLAGQAVEAVSPYAHAVADKVTPYTGLAAARIAPVVAGGAAVAHEAAERVGPAWESTRDRVSDDLLPKLGTALSAAAASPLVVEATRRGRATAAAARGELTLPEPAKGGSWLKRIAVVAALAGVAVVVVRRVLGGSQDSGWQAARPSTPPSPPSPPTTSAPVPPVPAEPADVGTAESDTASTDPQEGQNAHEAMAEADGLAQPEQPAEGGDEPVVETGTEATSEAETGAETASGYGEGSYVGDEPPAGFVIKGNENSMKYHLPDGGGYEQTVAEVWFDSEEAAQRAGFVRAQG